MRDIVVDLWKTTRFNMGYVGEDEATRLIFQLTTDLMTSKTFTIEFNVNGEITVINDISPTDNSIIYVVPEIFTTAEGDIGIQVVGYNDGKVIKSPVVYGRISKSQVGDSGIPLKAYHTHDNKDALDKFGEDEGGNPTYNGEPIGKSNTLYIPASLIDKGDGAPDITVETSFEQVGEAYTSGRELVVKLSIEELDLILPLSYCAPSYTYTFSLWIDNASYLVSVTPDGWFVNINNIDTSANSHTHDNKSVLDMLSDADGKLQYNGSDVGLKGDKGDTGAAFTYSDFTAEQLAALKGEKGDKGDKGDTGATGAQGEPGKDGADGKDGAPGADGTSATHSWNGTVLTITSASGTSSADLKGEKGDKGDKGDTGADGYTPVKGTDYWTAADKAEIVDDVLAALPTWTGGSY